MGDHQLIVGLLSPFSLEKCFAAVEARYRALRAEDRNAIDAIIRFPS